MSIKDGARTDYGDAFQVVDGSDLTEMSKAISHAISTIIDVGLPKELSNPAKALNALSLLVKFGALTVAMHAVEGVPSKRASEDGIALAFQGIAQGLGSLISATVDPQGYKQVLEQISVLAIQVAEKEDSLAADGTLSAIIERETSTVN